jgi:pimeloyl-ACP methyl ester carboxylesterase
VDQGRDRALLGTGGLKTSVVLRELLCTLVWVLSSYALSIFAADYARVQRWAEEIVPAILVGNPVYLQGENNRRFLAIYAKSPKPASAVILIHGMGVHPDWGLIHGLRTRLADEGYTTLSVQMPVLAADAKPEDYLATFPEAALRLARAAEFLRVEGHHKIALVSHSMGARMADYFLARHSKEKVKAWVAIGMTGKIYDAQTTPVLDIFGEQDLPGVLQSAAERAQALKNRPGSAQLKLQGADHFFNGHESALLQHVRDFLAC